MEHQPFVYGLFDPADAGHIRYVGMAPSRASRPYEHAKRARKNVTDSSHLMNWIRKVQSEGREPSVMILEQLRSGTGRMFLGFVESCYVKSLRQIGHRLTNENDGGWGGSCPSYKHTEEAKVKMREAARLRREGGYLPPPITPETRAKLIAANKRRVCSELTRERMSRAKKGKQKSAETKLRMGAAQKGKEVSQACRAKIRAALTGRKLPEETRLKMKAAWARRKARHDGGD